MRSIGFLGLAVVLLTCGSAQAASWDAAADFTSHNPNGVWSYWWGATGTSMGRHNSWGFAPAYFQGVSVWFTDTHGGRVAKSLSATAFTDNALLYPPGAIVFDGSGTANDDAVVCWTAPATGSYNFAGKFEILAGPQSSTAQAKTKVFKGIVDITGKVFPSGSGIISGPPYANLSSLVPGAKEPFDFTKVVNSGQLMCFGFGSIDGVKSPPATGFELVVTQQ